MAPIGGSCGARLAALAGLDDRAFASAFALMNVLDAWPGPASRKGAEFPIAEARLRTEAVIARFVGGRRVVLLGKRAGSALGVRGDYFRWRSVRGAKVVVVPHPSGVNRWYNDAANVERMAAFMRALAREAEEDRWRRRSTRRCRTEAGSSTPT